MVGFLKRVTKNDGSFALYKKCDKERRVPKSELLFCPFKKSAKEQIALLLFTKKEKERKKSESLFHFFRKKKE